MEIKIILNNWRCDNENTVDLMDFLGFQFSIQYLLLVKNAVKGK